MGALVNENGAIWLTRGDSYTFECEADSSLVFESGDVLLFSLKRPRKNAAGSEYDDKNPLIAKELDYSDPTNIPIPFLPADTEELGFGLYKYDICVYNGTTKRTTLITPTDFHICDEVHTDGNE